MLAKQAGQLSAHSEPAEQASNECLTQTKRAVDDEWIERECVVRW